MIRAHSTEVLENRIAPALVVHNPIADIVVGAGHSGTTLALSQLFDPLLNSAGHTIVTLTLNYDSDTTTPAIESTQIKLELFDDEAPLTVQNFLRYLGSSEDAAAAFVDTFFHRSVSNFVLQGGGFSASDIKNLDEHIDTFSTVHNEFSADRSNVRGTIAMAKVETNENTASSEWFVNLADNSSNLDNQNGGFTVFGKIVEGMDVIDKIAALPKANLGGALGAVPVQKFNPDPDNNSNTLSPTPGKDNLIRITDIDIEPAILGQVHVEHYSVIVGGDNPNVVQATVDANGKLQLTYDPTKSGVATVTVTADDGGDPVTDTFTVTLRPNLIVSVMDDSLGKILVPGEGGKVKFVVKNNGGANFSGMADFNFYLSKRDGANGTEGGGATLDPDEDLLLLGGLGNQLVKVDAAGNVEFTSKSVNLHTDLIKGSIDDYRLLVEIKPATGTTQELFTDDNVAVDGGVHVLTNQFGTIDLSSSGFGKRTNVKLTYLDPVTAKLVTLSLKGPGTGQVTLDEGDEALGDEQAELLVTGTTTKSQIKLAATGDLAFSQIDVPSFVGKIDFGILDKTGNIALSGGAKTVIFGDVDGESRLTIGTPTSLPPASPVSIKFGRVTDLTVESSQAIKSLQAIEWRDTEGADDSILAPSLSTLKITGDKKSSVAGNFEANLNVFGSSKVSNISVAGLVNNATIHATSEIAKISAGGFAGSSIFATKLSNITVAGAVDTSTIRTSGDIGKITVGDLIESNIFAGTDGRPASLTDFDTIQTIQSLTIKGSDGTFVDSQVAAAVINKISVRGVATASGDSDFGFVADKVGKYSRIGGDKLSKLDEPATKDEVGNYKLVIL
jgi:peptidyl-prolyl cis-trans isomerase A (cyclophilin A)